MISDNVISYLSVFDGKSSYMIELDSFGKSVVTFGRMEDNDIVLDLNIVSRYHGYFLLEESGDWSIHDGSYFDNSPSSNGLYCNNRKVTCKSLSDNDKIIIGYEDYAEHITMVTYAKNSKHIYQAYQISKTLTIIGRASDSDVILDHPTVMNCHCIVYYENGICYLKPASNNCEIILNGRQMNSETVLHDTDSFQIGDTLFVYQNGMLLYSRHDLGFSVEANNVCKVVGKGKNKKYINSNISFSINAGEFVAIIGGSGAGKSTLLNCLSGMSSLSSGSVTVGGDDLTTNYRYLKELIGYVPQNDIVYTELTLYKMLYYSAKLRMPKDYTKSEIEDCINNAINAVELDGYRDVKIGNLSGGQKKRASIAVELLSAPKLFFLDEPTSGLDPGTESNLMMMLKQMTASGRTVVLVTHTPLNLSLCDKIVVIGKGGRLCYCGKPEDAFPFFEADSYVDVYKKINNESEFWESRFSSQNHANYSENEVSNSALPKSKDSKWHQFCILTKRYLDLQLKDKKNLFVQLVTPVILGVLLYIAFASSFVYNSSAGLSKFSLTLSCCAFWIGMFSTIQEICKEKNIFLRERMANLKLVPYVLSKMAVIALLNFIQILLLLSVAFLLLGTPPEGKLMGGVIEYGTITYLTTLSASSFGLLVSSIVNNTSQAQSTAPLLLIPQILFSSIIVDLEGVAGMISYFICCRYSVVGYCTSSSYNDLPARFTHEYLGWVGTGDTDFNALYHFSDSSNSLLSCLPFSDPITLSLLALVVSIFVFLLLTIISLVVKGTKKYKN